MTYWVSADRRPWSNDVTLELGIDDAAVRSFHLACHMTRSFAFNCSDLVVGLATSKHVNNKSIGKTASDKTKSPCGAYQTIMLLELHVSAVVKSRLTCEENFSASTGDVFEKNPFRLFVLEKFCRYTLTSGCHYKKHEWSIFYNCEDFFEMKRWQAEKYKQSHAAGKMPQTVVRTWSVICNLLITFK